MIPYLQGPGLKRAQTRTVQPDWGGASNRGESRRSTVDFETVCIDTNRFKIQTVSKSAVERRLTFLQLCRALETQIRKRSAICLCDRVNGDHVASRAGPLHSPLAHHFGNI